MYLAGAVVAPWSLSQEVISLKVFTVTTIIWSLNSGNSMKKFKENSTVRNNRGYLLIVNTLRTYLGNELADILGVNKCNFETILIIVFV